MIAELTEPQRVQEPPEVKETPKQTLEDRVGHVSKVLRIVGTLTFVSAAASFLVQRWGVANDIERYLSLLGITALLPAAGVVCGVGLREGKSARTLLGALITILPVHFAVLGGLAYSQFALDASEHMSAAYALWRGGSAGSVVATVAGSVAVLGVLSWFAHATFARAKAGSLTAAAIAANGLLLIPIRTPWATAVLAGAAALLLLYRDQSLVRSAPELRTPEGRWARGLLFVPVLLILARAINLYPVDALFGAISLTGVALSALVWSFRDGTDDEWPARAAAVAVVGAGAFAALASLEFMPLWAAVATCGITTAFALIALGAFAPTARGLAVPMAAVVALVSTIFAGFADGGAVASVLGLAVGLGAAAYGYTCRVPFVLVVGLLQVAGSVLSLWQNAVAEYGFSSWGGLALVGVLTVMATSLLERWLRSRNAESRV
ncbi:MAG: hypothetical protein AAF654_05065 [Myxococcota bacterium]